MNEAQGWGETQLSVQGGTMAFLLWKFNSD